MTLTVALSRSALKIAVRREDRLTYELLVVAFLTRRDGVIYVSNGSSCLPASDLDKERDNWEPLGIDENHLAEVTHRRENARRRAKSN